MDAPDTHDTGAEALPAPAPSAAAPAPVEHPQLGGAWVRQPDGNLVREAHTRDQATEE